MIKFTDDSLYVKGTCNVLLSDPSSGDIYFQSSKMSTGNFSTSTNLNEIRAGIGNPIVAMIPSDGSVQVDFDSAEFSLWAKAAQLGAAKVFSAPVPTCQTVTASSTSISIVTTSKAPCAPLGKNEKICYVQEVDASSFIASDGEAYTINGTTGAVEGFTAVSGKKYKVWYYTQNVSAQKATISSFIDPKVVRLEAQIAVYSNKSGGSSSGTRVGWLYYTIPYLKMQGDATVTGDQTNADTTKISGQAIAYDADYVSEECTDCDASVFGYLVYAPDDAAQNVDGLAVVGGVVSVKKSTTAQIPVRIVMKDGSLVKPEAYTGFTFTLSEAPSGTTVSASGLISAGSTTGDCDCTITYGDFTCTVAVSVTN